MGKAVLDAGADAVFAGLRGFSRRGFEYELSVNQIGTLCGIARDRGKAVRLAVNSFPDSRNDARLLKDIEQCVNAGIQGLIINDPGLCGVLHRLHPGIGLHVSVGASTFSALDALFWRECGATGLVLLCDLRPEDVRPISEAVDLDLEILVHANRDFTFLGKCWISSYAHVRPFGRGDLSKVEGSPNRGGVCYRLCRASWLLESSCGTRGTTDLPNECRFLADELYGYAAAGVTCFKIQGREYSLALVVDIVREYRSLLDAMGSIPSFREALVCTKLDNLSLRRDAERSRRTLQLTRIAESK